MTPDFAKLSISPESSDGFASVGTILPKEEAALLPGGLFTFPVMFQRRVAASSGFDSFWEHTLENLRFALVTCGGRPIDVGKRHHPAINSRKETPMLLDLLKALLCLLLLMLPGLLASRIDLNTIDPD